MVDRLVNSEVNDRRIANVETCFGNSGQRLRVPGRVLVGEGVLVKMCRKDSKQRQFFLFNDQLVYGSIVISKKRYNKQHVIPLITVELEDLEDEGRLKNGWVIKSPSKSFAVYAATPTEKREWMMHIVRCVTDLQNGGSNNSGAAHAPVWIPDNEASRCMVCKRTQFNLMQRRHHCRKCGAVVCGACSSHSYKIEKIGKRPVRVCDPCFNKLVSGQDRDNPNVGQSDQLEDHASDSSGESDQEGNDAGQISAPTFYPG
ncbi:unnamed protein product, partial [Mesorhabditis belari]|uniref:Pleckstrin homology domain-containing family F member 2 n=1 Tax=Mesorhabditis belari TaxID=2138241 RepID=A0AAF3FC68_9BILA